MNGIKICNEITNNLDIFCMKELLLLLLVDGIASEDKMYNENRFNNISVYSDIASKKNNRGL